MVKKIRPVIWEARKVPDPELVQRLISEMGAPPEIAAILCQRGIDEPEKVKRFFNPRMQDLEDPFLMQDMEKAIDRIDLAIANRESVMIYGDYDVDGTTSVALTYQFFRDHFSTITYYIPDRYKEGYGISKQGIEQAISEGISLIIALDCGIRSIDLVSFAKEHGVDFIICDHHLPGERLPDAVAVLDPKRKDCSYPYKDLCGCGIGFKLIQAFSIKHDLDDRLYMRYLDLVCLAIASDIVPMTGENRILAHFGLKIINAQPSIGLRKLAEKAIQKEDLSIGDLVFYLGPRINAAGRMENATTAVELLIATDEDRAEELAIDLNRHNLDRRTVDEKITADLQEIVARNPDLLKRKTLVFYDPEWHKGVIGIAASRSVELFYKPSIILTGTGEKLSGSGRSIKGFDLHEALQDCAQHLIQFGGHTYAAGLTMNVDKLEDFRDAFEKVAETKLTDEDLLPRINYDAEIDINSINEHLYGVISRMAPFGPSNLMPTFYAGGLRDDGSGRIIGKTGEHISCRLVRASDSLAAVGFGMADQFDEIKKAEAFDACFQIQENNFRGFKSLQLMLKSIRPTNGTESIASEKD